MNQQKIGDFLKQLRKEKALTQEQLAETLNVSRRTVSRWETGSNLPDLDLLVIMADYYRVDLRELLDGERKEEKLNKELEETVIKVAEYSNEEKQRAAKMVKIYFVIGIVSLLVNMVLQVLEPEGTFWLGFTKGCTSGLALVAMTFGLLYVNGSIYKIQACKRRLIGRKDK